jgi:hypothetical protein
MNKIVLNKPLLLNKRYVVYLDSENKFSFSNKREAQDFIVFVGKEMDEATLFITEKLNLLSELYRLYFLADKDYKFKFQINGSIEFLNNRLSWMQSHEGSTNHDTILFHGVIDCIQELNTPFTVMGEKAAARRDTITKRRCNLKSHLLEMYYEKLMKIGIKPKLLQLQIRKAR